MGECAACTHRWHAEGADINNFLTLSQLTEHVMRMALSCDGEPERKGGAWCAVRRTKALFHDEALAKLSLEKEEFVRRAIRGGRCEVFVRRFLKPKGASAPERRCDCGAPAECVRGKKRFRWH